MRTRSWIVAALAWLVLQACSTPMGLSGGGTPAGVPTPCGSTPCKLGVAVQWTFVGQLQPVPSIDTLEGRGQSTITWDITTSGYTFAGPGIEFNGQGREVFQCSKTSDTQVVCSNRGTPGNYKYVITAKGGSFNVYPNDPWVVN